jgi:UDP-2,3-diacylglucosamine pyrophosphatase LpxH
MFLYVVFQQEYSTFILTDYTKHAILLCHLGDTLDPCPTEYRNMNLVVHEGPEILQFSPLVKSNLSSVAMYDNLWFRDNSRRINKEWRCQQKLFMGRCQTYVVT